MSPPTGLDGDRSPSRPGAEEPDVVLVGAGIMSTTLGVLLKELQPDRPKHDPATRR
jgi:Malate:quinone oxidoreductase (Mqo)